MGMRKVVEIDDALCTGCGECVPACAEGAIQIIDGKAKLIADKLCDGLGACLGDCPEGAIKIVEREAEGFDERAVEKARPVDNNDHAPHVHGGGCPGARVIAFDNSDKPHRDAEAVGAAQPSALRQWPIQLHLVPPTAPYYKKADILLAADCVAFAMGDFHGAHLKGRSLAIACPKLDENQETYLQKLVAMIDQAEINTLTVMMMEVPCCGGLLRLAKEATRLAKRKVPVKQIIVSLRGEILLEDWV